MIESHPSLGHAAMLVAAAVNEDAASGGAGAMPGGAGNVVFMQIMQSACGA